ncbi:antibiotic biosynthesis monooxygenase [Nocardioides sp. TRM66260-LWL]|uniref:putative quinol monooxygenase n=1 Tax=Nocardioides sp. TRM66260-LWL TaxID=2874478 RepID=UPI001CC668DD|nr:antibiotic biosynthesis monooxygenase [Nocardioides sp. TRM66260-LWL]MBZ5734675.1 antibiotic biosynthesis monooxygenase [Nocardioides sp. TRM66260-LWL]
MPEVTLTGLLIAHDDEQAATVARHLPEHVALTRAEPGCREFVVERIGATTSWRVQERFVDRAAFEAHQRRVAASTWGRATAHVERRYTVSEV